MRPRAGCRRLSIRLAAVVALVAAIGCASAAADTTSVSDNRNTRANRLDIRSTSAGHSGTLLRHTVRTYRRWRPRDLRSTRSRPRSLCLHVWRPGSNPMREQDYEICVRFANGRLSGRVFQVHPATEVTGAVRVTRPNARSIALTFAKETLGNLRFYRWQVVTGYTGRGCPRDPPFEYGCDDSAPTRAVRIHRLG
jgi:hypothetical protein